ncbi:MULTISPECIES: hypothetical protein [unclassified Microcoleus]|uniref:hypothetical protein n=1 Tax=unclassified Microcoleus TaxID=2642155 RepID=UPI001D42548E|nr:MULTISPECIES: hypothetical protein [unclassified Microcoleus]MCC3506253.1 hypothetical protein [Microcoleus sp. PH2017_19_SFW_U_A]MCC3473966.1 hypothetical protein [Microcoleus sp. PH2017_13_LAR_U_A]MCC3486050.1 hypothetical protein [Microcoleus sp. PH2017_14_LAR_D_A]MCC3523946.1 hypothetical protein [Microcoleus sp. PH2017_20_SFW_D_A]MCC3554956.1 hypothetical protein [Microcoleus sp. PH2017_35_SFW_U_B]
MAFVKQQQATKKMKLNEILYRLLEAVEKLEDNESVGKQWIKSIKEIDKSVSTGYSLVGTFISESEELEPGLYLIFQEIDRRFFLKKTFVKWDRSKKRMCEDENGNIIFEARTVEEIETARRAILFDFSGTSAELLHCTFLPQKWAKKLWEPITEWLESQPNLETKVKFWEAEVAERTDALRQAQQRLEALKRQIASDAKELDPETKKWLQTGAVLGGKKKAIGERLL